MGTFFSNFTFLGTPLYSSERVQGTSTTKSFRYSLSSQYNPPKAWLNKLPLLSMLRSSTWSSPLVELKNRSKISWELLPNLQPPLRPASAYNSWVSFLQPCLSQNARLTGSLSTSQASHTYEKQCYDVCWLYFDSLGCQTKASLLKLSAIQFGVALLLIPNVSQQFLSIFLPAGYIFETYEQGRYYNKAKQTYQFYIMKQEEKEEKQLTNYFTKYNQLIKANPKLDNIDQIGNKIEKLINQGSINIDANPQEKINGPDTGRSIKLLSKQIESKKNQFNKELLLLNMSLSRSSYLVNKKQSKGSEIQSTRVFKRRTRTDVSQQDYEQYQKRRESSENRLKQLKKLKKELMRKKSSISLKKQKEREHQQSVQKQIERAKHELQKNAKLNKISERMKKLEQSRISRLDTLRNSCVRSTSEIPKYKIIRYRFDCKEIEYEQEQKQLLKHKNMLKQRQFTRQSLLAHQREYNKKLKTMRQKNVIEQEPEYNRKREAEFNLIKNPDKINQKFEQNKLKAKLFEDKLAEIRNIMPIDPQIGKQFEVAKDKSKHPFKYHYLKKKKNITDLEIYQNYSHFNFNAHPVELGNFYLQEINKKNRSLVNKNDNLTSKRSKTDGSTSEQKIKYKDYLDEARKKIKTQTKKQDQVDQLMKKYGSKSKVIQVLQNKAQVHTNNSLKKIQKLRRFDTYTNTLKLQKQVDDQFINSIKTKLKCFQVK